MYKRIPLTVTIGDQFDRLWVLDDTVIRKGRNRYVECVCRCGNVRVVAIDKLFRGHSTSCGGCKRGDANRRTKLKHGHARKDCLTTEYYSWSAMIGRCKYDSTGGFENYGGRGISVCERWSGENGFENFLQDMGPKPSPKHSIDRFPDKNGNYEPGNCRWATDTEQIRNRRNTITLTLDGITRPAIEWSEIKKIGIGTIYDRISLGWTDEEVLSRPVRVMDGP